MRRRLAIKVAMACWAMAAALSAQAQGGPWPNRPVRMIVPHAAGTSAAALAADLASDHAYWAQLVREVGVKAE